MISMYDMLSDEDKAEVDRMTRRLTVSFPYVMQSCMDRGYFYTNDIVEATLDLINDEIEAGRVTPARRVKP